MRFGRFSRATNVWTATGTVLTKVYMWLNLRASNILGEAGQEAAMLATAGHHALPFLEFVATNPSVIKEYIVVVFQNSQMIEIVDALEFEYNRLKRLFQEAITRP